MQYTRHQILDHLRKHHNGTVPELSQHFNLTITNIRHHIKALEAQGLVAEIGKIPTGGRGRPTKQYGLTMKARPHNLDQLSLALLNLLMKGQDCGSALSISERFLALAEEMIGKNQPHPNPIHRLNQAADWFNQRGYRARWEAAVQGPRVILEDCPYHAIREEFPAICQLDQALLGRLVTVDHEQIQRQHLYLPGTRQCIFEL
jgi:DeoR family suf operon transcriptional repressor